MDKFWSVLFGAVLLGAFLLTAIALPAGWWLPKDVSTYGHEIDFLTYLILVLTGIPFVGVSVVMVYCMYRFVAQPGRKALFIHGSHKLELIWTAVPAAVLVLIALIQIPAWARIKFQSRFPVPDHAVEVSARQFEWRIRYPNSDNMAKWTKHWKEKAPDSDKTGEQMANDWVKMPQADDLHVVNELHVWKGNKGGDGEYKSGSVRVALKTRDVLHSFFLPNLRIKQDALPGKTIPVWFQATEANAVYTVYNPVTKLWDIGGDPNSDEEKKRDPHHKRWEDGYNPKTKERNQREQIWELACAELCGWGHTKMAGRLYVHQDRDDYVVWLKDAEAKQKQRYPDKPVIAGK